jgi:hypothetical protein
MLAARRPLFVELCLDLCALGSLLGDGSLGAALFGTLAVMAGVVALRLALDVRQLPSLPCPPRHGNQDRENDQGPNDDGDDRNR